MDLEDLRWDDLEERAVVEVFDARLEMEFFVIPDCPDCVSEVRLDVLWPVIFVDRDRDVDPRVLVEEKLFPTFRMFDRARTLEAF